MWFRAGPEGAVGPRASRIVTAVATCCDLVLQVKDNLKLFHEVQGPVFRSQRALRALPGLQRPRVLPGMRVGGVDILNSDQYGRDDNS